MDKETASKIRELEKERDRNLRIHCPRVAAKFQRRIDKELKSAQKLQENEYRNSEEHNQQV